jgi:hypothetical protein
MITIYRRRCIVAPAVVLTAAMALGLAGGTTAGAATRSDCAQVTAQVSIAPGAPEDQDVTGELCGGAPGRTVHLLVSGATYGSFYWDPPYRPEIHSYVRAMNDSGAATLNLERIGIGGSSHPPAAEVTVGSNAWVLHQVVGKLRAGRIGGIAFPRVVEVGHSLGSLMVMTEAGIYRDVDGVVLTGISHNFASANSAVLFGTLIPTQVDPVLRSRSLPLGYLTTAPGLRETDFYWPPTTDPAMAALDEQTKQTVTPTELATVVDAYPAALGITAPVLLVDGNQDQLVCGPLGSATPCDSPASYLTTERLFYPRAASYQQVVLPDTGHSIDLHTTAPRFFEAVRRWVETVGLA